MIDPDKPGFVKELEGLHPDFREELFVKIPKDVVFKYIIITYDVESPYVIKYNDWATRRREAAKAAGFPKNGKHYTDESEKIILGKVSTVNTVLLRYIFLQNDIDFIKYLTKQVAYSRQVRLSIEQLYEDPRKYDQLQNNIDKLSDEIKLLRKSIFHGDETRDLMKSLYDFTQKISLNFRPEDVANKKENGEDIVDNKPYPDGYDVDEMKFLGDE